MPHRLEALVAQLAQLDATTAGAMEPAAAARLARTAQMLKAEFEIAPVLGETDAQTARLVR